MYLHARGELSCLFHLVGQLSCCSHVPVVAVMEHRADWFGIKRHRERLRLDWDGCGRRERIATSQTRVSRIVAQPKKPKLTLV